MTESSDPCLEVSGLTRQFRGSDGPIMAVDGLDLSVKRGEIVAFLGPNGAGKTTTIDMILGLTSPSGGDLRVLGQSPRQAIQSAKVGALLQTGGLLRDLTVRETVSSIAALQGTPRARVDEVMATTNLTGLAKRKVAKCSGGEQQRIKFALALLPDPELLVLDEPTTGMDVSARHDFWETMHTQAAAGRTIVFATHYLEEAQNFAQRIVLIAKGKILADGPTYEVRAMTDGRTLSATFDDAVAVERLREMPGVTSAEVKGSRVSFTTLGSDELARAVLDAGGRDLTISEPSLDTVFMTLTKDAR